MTIGRRPVPPPQDFEGIPNRQPCTYLASATGINTRESGPSPVIGDPNRDGMLFNNSQTKFADVLDGSAHTIMLGEAIVNIDIRGIDPVGNSQAVDHWYFGSTDQLNGIKASECLGSTAIPLNLYRDKALDDSDYQNRSGVRVAWSEIDRSDRGHTSNSNYVLCGIEDANRKKINIPLIVQAKRLSSPSQI